MTSCAVGQSSFANLWSSKQLKTVFVTVLFATLIGCSGRKSAPVEKLTPVTGSVKIAGQPTAGIRITLAPNAPTPGTGGFGITDADGKFELVHKSQKKGVVPGSYTVHFSRFLMPNGAEVPPKTSPYASGATESIPKMWSDPTISRPHNTVTVAEGGKPLEFDIPKK
jgi:hypothetical protein